MSSRTSRPADPPGRPDGGPVAHPAHAMVLAVALGAGFGVLLVLVGVEWPPLTAADDDVARSVNGQLAGRPWAVGMLQAVTDTLQPWTFRVAALIASVVVARRSRFLLAAWPVVAVWGAGVLVWAFKAGVDRARPVVPDPVSTAAGQAFPSGHAAGAAAGAAALLLLARPYLSRTGRMWATTVAVVTAAVVAVTRVALGVHFVSDVVGGALLALAWVALTAAAFSALARWRADRPSVRPGRP